MLDHVQTGVAQLAEEPIRIADTSNGMYVLSCVFRQRCAQIGFKQARDAVDAQLHRYFSSSRNAAIGDAKVDLVESFQRLAQWAGRQ